MGMNIKKSKGSVLAVPTSSMGDIAFLLIIFFMLTSKFMQESHIQCEIPGSPDVVTIEDMPVSVMVDEQGTIWLQGQELIGANTKAQAQTLKEELDKLRIQQKDPKNFVVMFKVHKTLIANQYGPVIKKMAEAGVKVSFVGESAANYKQ